MAVLLVSACGVPTDESAHVAARADVPFGLLDEDRQPVAGAERVGGVVAEVYLYSEEGEMLVAVERRFEEPALDAILADLESGPSETEAGRGLRSALDDIEAIDGVEVSGGVATVDLRSHFGEVSGTDQLIALAQIVFTATARPGIGQVLFTLEGAAIEVPVGDGSLKRGPMTRGDYRTIAAQDG